MTSAVIATTVAFVICLYMALSARQKHIRENNPHYVIFMLTVGATFIGVVLGFRLSVEHEQKTEKETVIALLESTIMDLDTKKTKTLWQYTGMRDTYIGIDNNPLPYPNLLSNVLNANLVIKTISPITYSRLMQEETYLSNYGDRIIYNYRRISEDSLTSIVGEYGENLYYISSILKSEVLYLKGEFNFRELLGVQEYFRNHYKHVADGGIVARPDLAKDHDLTWLHPFSPEKIVRGDSLPTGN